MKAVSNRSVVCLEEVEEAIAKLWAEALELTELPKPEDDFFGLGGESLSMVNVEILVQEEFAIDFPSGLLLSAPTLREFTVAVVDLAGSGEGTAPLSG